MPLSRGERLGPYELESQIGAGGMGQVWKARDTRLDRVVAIKISAERFSERFGREAQAVAALNHPHICTLHDVGPNYLVMEYIDGHVLKGPLPLEEVFRLGIQIAEALDAAHRKGVTHRDLKPANILVTKSGVKLLDFGLAKIGKDSRTVEEDVTRALTQEGSILGTLQYMSPEQLQAKQTDARSDIFAFGLVLYEMLTGKRAFEASSQASVIGAILHKEPEPVTSIAPVTPPALERLIRRCIAKDPEDRWQSARDIAAELQWIAGGGAPAEVPALLPVARKNRERALGIAAAMLALMTVAAGAIAFKHMSEVPPQPPVVQFRLDSPEDAQIVDTPLISPDGSTIAAIVVAQTGQQVWLRSLASPGLRVLSGSDGYLPGGFSPDSHALILFNRAHLKRVDLASGAIQSLGELGRAYPGLAWSRSGAILLGGQKITRASANGGVPKVIVEPDPNSNDYTFNVGNFLPDGRHFLFQTSPTNGPSNALYVGSLDDPKFRKTILQNASMAGGTTLGPPVATALYAPPGWLLFLRDGVLLAQPFDARKLELSGEPATLADHVAGFTVSENGSLVWRAGSFRNMTELVWYERSGKRLDTVGEPAEIANPVLSPDGKRLLVTIRDPITKTRDIWIWDLTRGANSRLTFDPAEDFNPVWSPDGSYVIFSSSRKGRKDIYRKRADGVGPEEELLSSNIDKNVDSVSPDGKYVLYNTTVPGKAMDIFALPLTGDRKPTEFVAGPFVKTAAQFSPDGRWVAYDSEESGLRQIFVQTAPGSGLPFGKWQISSTGGTQAQWRRDGKELFFPARNTLMAASVKTGGSSFEFETPVKLFDMRRGISLRNHFAPSADGQRFLFAWPKESDSTGRIFVVLNWPSLLKKP